MNIRVLVVAGLAVAVAVLVWALSGGGEEEALVEASLEAMVAAVEEHRPEDLAEYIASDYRDRLGQDATGAVKRVTRAVQGATDLRIELAGLDIDVEEDTGHATAAFRPIFHGPESEGLRVRAERHFERGRKLELRLRKHGSRYLVVRADMAVSLMDAL